MNRIQATLTGKDGHPRTLCSVYDPETRILVVSVEAQYRAERREGCAVITDMPDIPRDALFTDADFPAAIAAYHALKNGVAANGESARLVFSERAARANPDQYIEQDGMEASGHIRYRVSEAIGAAQVAALATCLYATRIANIEKTLGMADELSRQFRLMAGEGCTI
jgi:hypothetical protein